MNGSNDEQRCYKQTYRMNNMKTKIISKSLLTLALVLAFGKAITPLCGGTQPPVNAVIEWNRTLLAIVRTPGSQPATIHSTRNFAILHAAIYDAVNNTEAR